jgi:hypothetical protein
MSARNAWSPRNIYMYVVCLITLVIVIFATVNLVRAVVELAYPDPSAYISFPRPIDDKLGMDQKQWDQQQEYQRQAAQRRAILSLVGNGAMLLLAGPLYIYHWRKIDREAPAAPPV